MMTRYQYPPLEMSEPDIYQTSPPVGIAGRHIWCATERNRLMAIRDDADMRIAALDAFRRAADEMQRLGYSRRQVAMMVVDRQ